MAIGNADTYTYNNFLTLPEVFSDGIGVYMGNQITAGIAFKRNSDIGNQITTAATFKKSNFNCNQISDKPPISSKLVKNELVRFGFRSPISRLHGFLPPQISILNNQNAVNFDFRTISTSMTLWLDTSDVTSVVVDGSNRISEWKDKSGGLLRPHIQTTASKRPYYDVKLNGLKGMRLVNSEKINLDFSGKAETMPFLNPPYTMIVVSRHRTTTATAVYGLYQPSAVPPQGVGFIWRADVDADPDHEYFFDYRGNTGHALQRVISTEDIVFNRAAVVSVRTIDRSTRNIRHNGVQTDDTGDGGVMTLTGDRVSTVGTYYDASNPTGAAWMEGDMFEVHVFAEALDDSTLEFVENTLASKWGIAF